MLIKLTNCSDNKTVLVNEREISHIKAAALTDKLGNEFDGSRVELHKETLYVKETPDQIHSMINAPPVLRG